jgi:HK97 family phage prohead protease
MREKETRVLKGAELRIAADPDGRKAIEGYAIRFNDLSDDLGGWRERIDSTAIRLDDDLRAFFDHDSSMVLGRRSAGTLDAHVTDDGVFVRAYPPDTQWAKDLLVSMERQDINQMSFGFFATDDTWQKADDGTPIRTVLGADVFEVSIVAMPAYPTTSVQARNKAAALVEAPTDDGERLDAEADDDEAGRDVRVQLNDHIL